MNKVLVLMVLIGLNVSCSSRKAVEKEVDKEAKATTPVVDPRTQYALAISAIRSNKDLKEDQKDQLVNVVNSYAMKSRETRLKQSQYRAVLVSEMLNSGTKNNPKVEAAKRNLIKLDEESSKDLGKFVRDFKHHAGDVSFNATPMNQILRFQ